MDVQLEEDRLRSVRTRVANEPMRDGRAARSERTRDQLVAAVLRLVAEGNVSPTSEQIAARAGVASRSLYQRFAGREALFAAALERQCGLATALGAPVSCESALRDRIAAYAEQRATSWELLTPILRATLTWERSSETISARLAALRLQTRTELEGLFAAELAGLQRSDRKTVFAAVVGAGEWATWENLRTQQRLTVKEARIALQRTLIGLLEPKGRQDD
jgi:TetR/AcrR family transcriptional regulator, regulator of autoinduction and epiphytic fitness